MGTDLNILEGCAPTIEEILERVKDERIARRISNQVNRSKRDSLLERYIADAPEQYRTFTRFMLYGLKEGIDFELSRAAEFKEATHIEKLSEHLGFEIKQKDSKLICFQKPAQILSVNVDKPIPDSKYVLVYLMGKSFSSNEEVEVRKRAIRFLEGNGAIYIPLKAVYRTIPPQEGMEESKEEVERYALNIVRELDSGSMQESSIEYQINKQSVRLTKKRPKFTGDIESYFESGLPIGYFQVIGDCKIEIKRFIPEGNEVYATTFDPEDAKFLVQSVIINHEFRDLNHYLRIAGHSRVAQALRQQSSTEVNGQYKKARDLVESLRDIEIESEEIISRIRQKYPPSFFGRGSRKLIQGTLGELFTLEILQRLEVDNRLRFVDDTKGWQETLDERGYILIENKSGSNIKISNLNSRTICEIDTLVKYEGIPIIFESKTTHSGTKKSSYESQTRTISEIYGVSPIFVTVKFSEGKAFTIISPDKYTLTLPFRRDIIKEANGIYNENLRALINKRSID
jgi:hypothetical protein